MTYLRSVLLVAFILSVLFFVMNRLAYGAFKLTTHDFLLVAITVVSVLHAQISHTLRGRSAGLQERVRPSGDGWYYLVPSPLQRYRIAVGVLLTALFAGLYLFVEEPRVTAKWISIISIFVTVCLVYRAFGRRTRWNNDRIEQRHLFFRPYTIPIRDVAGVHREFWFEDVYIDGVDGARIRIPPIQIGSHLLMGLIPDEEEKAPAKA